MTNDSILKFYGYRFTTNVKNLPQEEVQRRADRIVDYLSDPSHIGSTGMFRTFYYDGCVREMGFQYCPATPIRILVNSDSSNNWTVRDVTSRDPEIISRFVKAYDGINADGNISWFFFPDFKDVHVLNV